MSVKSLPYTSGSVRRSSLKRKFVSRLSSCQRVRNAPSPEAVDSLVRNAILHEKTRASETLSDSGYAGMCRPLLSGESMLHAAVDANQKQVVLYLLAKGADVNAVDSDGWTALHRSVYNSNINMAKLLIGNGADRKVGYILPVDLAMECDTNMIELLARTKKEEDPSVNGAELLTRTQTEEGSSLNGAAKDRSLVECSDNFAADEKVIDFETALSECQREGGEVNDDVTNSDGIGGNYGIVALTSKDCRADVVANGCSGDPDSRVSEATATSDAQPLKTDLSAREVLPIRSAAQPQETSQTTARRGSERRSSGRWGKVKTTIKRLSLNCDEAKDETEEERRRHQSEESARRSCVHSPVAADGTLLRRHSWTKINTQGRCFKITLL